MNSKPWFWLNFLDERLIGAVVIQPDRAGYAKADAQRRAISGTPFHSKYDRQLAASIETARIRGFYSDGEIVGAMLLPELVPPESARNRLLSRPEALELKSAIGQRLRAH